MLKREDKNIPMTNSTTTHLLALYFFCQTLIFKAMTSSQKLLSYLNVLDLGHQTYVAIHWDPEPVTS